jgi:hypothetical protein
LKGRKGKERKKGRREGRGGREERRKQRLALVWKNKVLVKFADTDFFVFALQYWGLNSGSQAC